MKTKEPIRDYDHCNSFKDDDGNRLATCKQRTFIKLLTKFSKAAV
jgi:hypothetical protein